MLFFEPMSVNVNMWAWAYDQDGIFFNIFDDIDGIC
jgi:hypothetical protein